MMALRPVINRYGEAIEWDLHSRLGMDILDWFRGVHPWGKLRRLLDQLLDHSDSHFAVAQQNDPDLVALVMARPGTKRRGQWRPRAVEMGLHGELLARILDRLGELTAIESSHPLPKGAKVIKPPKQFPRPMTEVERWEDRQRAIYLDELDSDVREAQERYRQIQAEAG